MSDNERIMALLERIEANQRNALAAQERHLQIAQGQVDRSDKAIQESIELQRMAVARQGRILRTVVPLILLALTLLGYLFFEGSPV